MIKTAEISPDGVYRYELTRRWGDGPFVCWVMLNPSTADAEVDDQTIGRCIGFARRWNMAGLKVVNLYALRATDPQALKTHPDPIGCDNAGYVHEAICASAFVVVAWGASDPHRGSGGGDILASAWGANVPVSCLGRTRAGFPRHPLYLKADTLLEVWP